MACYIYETNAGDKIVLVLKTLNQCQPSDISSILETSGSDQIFREGGNKIWCIIIENKKAQKSFHSPGVHE